MSAHTRLTCDTVTGGIACHGHTDLYHTCIVSFARELAAREGWSVRSAGRSGEALDLCPDCAPRRAAPSRRIPGAPCPPSAPCHVLGHDKIGHRLTNLLAATGMSLDDAAALTKYDLVRVHGLGPTGLARLRSRLSSKRTTV